MRPRPTTRSQRVQTKFANTSSEPLEIDDPQTPISKIAQPKYNSEKPTTTEKPLVGFARLKANQLKGKEVVTEETEGQIEGHADIDSDRTVTEVDGENLGGSNEPIARLKPKRKVNKKTGSGSPARFRKRAKVPLMFFSLKVLDNLGLNFLASIIQFQGWEKLFVSEQFPTVPACHDRELEFFFCNLSVGQDLLIKSEIGIKVIEFDYKKLGTMLQIPSDGESFYPTDDSFEWSTFSCASAYSISLPELISKFSNNTISEGTSICHTVLSPQHKLLYEFVRRCLLPRGEGRGKCRFRDLIYMDLLDRGVKINLPLLICKHMAYVVQKKDHALPYGGILTPLFPRFGVKLTGKTSSSKKCDRIFLQRLHITVNDGALSFAGKKVIQKGKKRQRDVSGKQQKHTKARTSGGTVAETGSGTEGELGYEDDFGERLSAVEQSVCDLKTEIVSFKKTFTTAFKEFRSDLKLLMTKGS